MKELDFKNLTKEQEAKLRELLVALSESVSSHIDGISASPDDVTIYAGDKNMSLSQLKKEIEKMTPIAIDHFRMYFNTMETIVRIRSKSKKKSFFAKLRFW